jgi:hypothetical protein
MITIENKRLRFVKAKDLEAAFPGKSKEIRGLISGSIDVEQYEPVQRWVEMCFHMPSRQEMIDEALNHVLDGYGIEAIWGESVTPVAVYVNMGETYTTTLLYDCIKQVWVLTSWGDWVERYDKKYKIT